MKTKIYLFVAIFFSGLVLFSCQKDEELNTYASDSQSQVDLKNTYSEDHDYMLDPITNFPDPFYATTTITYHVKEFSRVRLLVYNDEHTWFQNLVDKKQAPGTYQVEFSGQLYAPGKYIARLKIGERRYYETMTKVEKWEISETSADEKY